MKRLDSIGVKYYYYELPPFEVVNNLYNILDLYVVAARYEGGPQAIVECAASKCPIISTDVGIASDILNKSSIFKPNEVLLASPDVDHAHKKVQDLLAPNGFAGFVNMFNKIIVGN